ncbi:MAG: PBSX family phage terminase large subunit [Oscillospiraceae bacterium]|nr:PBSX family phage terminase large subunit [Oscillospiraceae bacterium]
MNYSDRLRTLERRKRQRRGVSVTVNMEEHIAPVYLPLHDDIVHAGHQYYNLPGGRGSCKSSFVSLEIVNGIMSDKSGNSNAVVFRRIAGTMRESVYAQISWAIAELDAGHLWRGSVSPMQYTYLPTGAQIIFRGLDDSSKLKSIKPRRGIFRYVWFEEFSELPGPNFQRSVLQSVVRGGNDFAVFRSFNPPMSANNWVNTLVREPDERSVTLLTDYTMIPREWLGESFLYEAERLREVNEAAYRHEYLGEPTGTGGEVFPNLEIRRITEEEINQMSYFYNGLDFGFATDPMAFLRMSYDRSRETLFLLDEIYQLRMRNSEAAGEIIRRGYNDVRTVCDAAEPKSILDLRDHGLHAKESYKRPNCVQYRVKWLQHRKIVIDPKRTPNAYREFVGYSYSTDKDGNFLADLPDKDNHTIDAAAYGLQREIWARQVERKY